MRRVSSLYWKTKGSHSRVILVSNFAGKMAVFERLMFEKQKIAGVARGPNLSCLRWWLILSSYICNCSNDFKITVKCALGYMILDITSDIIQVSLVFIFSSFCKVVLVTVNKYVCFLFYIALPFIFTYLHICRHICNKLQMKQCLFSFIMQKTDLKSSKQ